MIAAGVLDEAPRVVAGQTLRVAAGRWGPTGDEVLFRFPVRHAGEHRPYQAGDRVLAAAAVGDARAGVYVLELLEAGPEPRDALNYEVHALEGKAIRLAAGSAEVLIEGDGTVRVFAHAAGVATGSVVVAPDGKIAVAGPIVAIDSLDVRLGTAAVKGAARVGDPVEVEIPIGTVIVAAPSGTPNAAPITLTGTVTAGSATVKASD